MVVLQIVGFGSGKFGGFERYLLELARQLQAGGGQLLLVFEFDPLVQTYIDELLKTNALWFSIPFTKNKINYTFEITKLIQKYKPDIVHTNFSSNVFVSLIAARLKNVKATFHTEHCVPVFNGIRQVIAKRIISFFADKIFGVSQMITSVLKANANIKNVETLYLGVEDHIYDKEKCKIKYGIPQNKIIITNIAFHNSVKGVDVLLKAIAILRYEFGLQNFFVCQIGKGQSTSETEYLHSLEKELKIESCIMWMGVQNNVSEILFGSDIYCQPSRSEGISMSIMEASFAKLPTVATRVGGISEAARENENGILVDNEDANALAVALQLLINNKDLRYSMGDKARKIAESDFSIKNQVSKLITEYLRKIK